MNTIMNTIVLNEKENKIKNYQEISEFLSKYFVDLTICFELNKYTARKSSKFLKVSLN